MAEPAYWLSALSEELAMLCDNGDSIGVSAQLRYHAHIHAISERDLTALVMAEWSRRGIVTVPSSGYLRGWAR
jgi:hypothetical protein